MSTLSTLLEWVRGWSSTVTIETVHGSFVSRRNDHITRQLQQFSAHTRNELAMLLSLVRAGDIIIDIGAHIGTFAIPLARRVGDEGKVYAFEADSGNFTLLEKNVELNNLTARIVPVNAIIHDRPARFRRIDPDPTNSGMFTFLPEHEDSVEGYLGYAVLSIDDWARGATLHRVDLLKIDVEGGEMGVLNCCRSVIDRFHPLIYIEINREALQRFGTSPSDIDAFLSVRGYRYFRNTGPRNSSTDDFTIRSLQRVEEGGAFYDLLAVHESSARLTKQTTL